jgi:hypothetical protein
MIVLDSFAAAHAAEECLLNLNKPAGTNKLPEARVVQSKRRVRHTDTV